MTTKNSLAAALAGAAILAVPAAAAAHPSVYETDAVIADAGAPDGFTTQRRYVVANHGFTYVLRESNGKTTGGTISYAKAPSALRGAATYDVLATPPDSANAAIPSPISGAQPHATCDVPALTSESAIRSWQGTDPFYAYVPFQRGAAGLEDDPATWIPKVEELTGVDLSAIPDTDAARKAACEDLTGATYVPADATQSTVAAFNSGLIAETVEQTEAPLRARIATFEQRLAAAEAAQRTATTARAAAEAARTAAEARATAAEARLAGAGAPGGAAVIGATGPKGRISPSRLASSGVPVAVTGPAGQVVRVRGTVAAKVARRLRLASTVLGSKAGTIGRDGRATITVRPSAAARARLRKASGSVPVRLEVVSAAVKVTASR